MSQTTPQASREKYIEDLRQAVDEYPEVVSGPVTAPPRHVFALIASLIPHQPAIVWADHHYADPTNGFFSGRLIFFTSDVVVLADLTQIDSRDVWHNNQKSLGSTEVVVFPRSGLRALSMRTPQENGGGEWVDISTLWAEHAEVRLQYDGGRAIDLPLSAGAGILDLLPALVRDLSL